MFPTEVPPAWHSICILEQFPSLPMNGMRKGGMKGHTESHVKETALLPPPLPEAPHCRIEIYVLGMKPEGFPKACQPA